MVQCPHYKLTFFFIFFLSGMWYGILDFINLVGVISNGFLIAFTSQWGLKYDLTTRLWICIGFEVCRVYHIFSELTIS